MSVLATGAFWAATAERAVRTAAQSALGILTVNAADPLGIDWGQSAGIVGVATVISVLMAVASSGSANQGPGLLEQVPPAPAP